MDAREKLARKLLVDINKEKALEPEKWYKWPTIIRRYDEFLSLAKSIYLGAGASWAINTLHENVAKSFLADGPSTMLKSLARSTGDAIYKASYSDKILKFDSFVENNGIKNIFKSIFNKDGILSKLTHNDPFREAAAFHNVIDKSFTDEMRRGIRTGQDIFKSITRNERDISEIMQIGRDSGRFQKMADVMWNFIPARAAAAFENGARLTVFKELYKNNMINSVGKEAYERMFTGGKFISALHPTRVVGATDQVLKNNPIIKASKQAMEEAAEQTNRIFYDYSDVTAGEKYIGKRLGTFYSFMARDVPFWADAFFDASGRQGIIESFSTSYGDPLDEYTRAGLPEYARRRIPRLDESGEVVIMPSLTGQSAVDVAEETLDIFKGEGTNLSTRLAPIPKTITQLAQNKGDFGGQIRPTEDKPIVRVPESMLTAIPEEMLMKLPIKRDPVDGRLYTNSDTLAIINYLSRSTIPQPPAVGQFVNRPFIEKEFRGRTSPQAMQFSPVKPVYQTPEQHLKQVKRNLRKEMKKAMPLTVPSERRRRRIKPKKLKRR